MKSRLPAGGVRSILDVLTVALVIAGLGAWIYRPRIPEVPTRARALVTPDLPARSESITSVDAASIVRSNIFSTTRAAPAARYNPSDGSTSGEVPEEPTASATPVVPPRVYGTMTGPTGAMALVQPDSSGASGRLFREGERIGPYRIEQIRANSVVFRGPGGRVEVRVEQRTESVQ